MANSASTAVYAHGDIKWYAIYKSIMNASPVIIAYLCFIMGGKPYWLYIPMIVFWGIGGDVVIVRYAKELCGLSISRFLYGVVAPILFVTITMCVGGYIVIIIFDESFLRLVITCAMTTIGMFFSFLLFGLTKDERNYLRRIHRNRKYADLADR